MEVIAAVVEDGSGCGVEMMRPVYRWKSFWLGVLVLAFLGWAVLDSFTYRRCVTGMGGQVKVEQVRGGVRLMWEQPVDGAKWRKWWVWDAERWEVSPGDAPEVFRWGVMNSLGYRGFSIPHWMLLMLFPVVWCGFLVWKMRKGERVTMEEVGR